jgi:hypothetical protein
MKNLLYVSLIIAIVVVINEFAYIGSTSLAWVVIALALAVGLNTIYLIKKSQ